MTDRLIVYETEAKNNGFRFVLGVDEVGRGPLAGPVVAAAVWLRSFDFKVMINDSKKMTEKARLKAFDEIFANGYVGIGIKSEVAIDELNILNASHRAMEEAVMHLLRQLPPELKENNAFLKEVILLIDGNSYKSILPYQHKTIIGGDAKSVSIAAASIVAKVYRDRLMERYDTIYPGYGFGKHKGYPTSTHREAIKRQGPSRIHRRSFTLL